MARFAGRIVHLLLVLIVVGFALTFLIDLAPGDPAYAILGENAAPEQIVQIHKDLHLDDPFYDRYADWVDGVVHFDFGTSYLTKQPVADRIVQAIPVTAELIILTMILSLLIAIPVGIYCAYKPGGVFDRLWMLASAMIISVPPFVSALVLVFIFALQLKNFPIHFPATGWVPLSESLSDNLWYMFLPVVTLSCLEIPRFSLLLRADMISTLQEDFVLAARARGVSTPRILFRHALRPSSFSLVTVSGLALGQLIGGAVVVEVLFALPGLGQLLYNGITTKDVPMVQGLVMFIAVAYVVINMLIDVFYGYLDPRVRLRSA